MENEGAPDENPRDIINPQSYSLRIYKKLMFLATSGNSLKFFINRIKSLERFGKFPPSILASIKSVVLDNKQFEDDATYEDYKTALEEQGKSLLDVKMSSRDLILKEQAIRFTYGRVGTFEESKEYTEAENIFNTLETLNKLTVILKSHI